MHNANLYTKLIVDMFGKMLGRIYAAVLSACASEAEHQTRKTALNVAAHMGVGQFVNVFKECKYFAVVLKKAYHRLVKPRQFFVRLVTAGVVRAAKRNYIRGQPAAPCCHTSRMWPGRQKDGLHTLCCRLS